MTARAAALASHICAHTGNVATAPLLPDTEHASSATTECRNTHTMICAPPGGRKTLRHDLANMLHIIQFGPSRQQCGSACHCAATQSLLT